MHALENRPQRPLAADAPGESTGPRRKRRRCGPAGFLVPALLLVALGGEGRAQAPTQSLTQPPGMAGCLADDVFGEAGCTAGRGLLDASSVAVSADGANVYVASASSDAVAIFDRDPASGELTQKADTAGCVAEDGAHGCAAGRGLLGAASVAVSADVANVYVAAREGAVTIFDRDPTTGALTQKAGLAGCISEAGGDTAPLECCEALAVAGCAAGASCESCVCALDSFCCATQWNSICANIANYRCDAQCSCRECASGAALAGATSVAVSPDGHSVYVAAARRAALAIFDRAADGTLTQKAGAAGCISDDGSGGDCALGRKLDGATAVAVSADAASVYVAAPAADAVAIFDRAPDGSLTQKDGVAGCMSELAGECTAGRGLLAVKSVAVSADAAQVYAASAQGDAVAVFERAPASGELTQRAGAAGCISETGLGTPALACCEAQDSAGCADAACETCVCALDSHCCEVQWDELCASDDVSLCEAECGCQECAPGKALDGVCSVAVSSDTADIYATSPGSHAVAIIATAAASLDVDRDGLVLVSTDVVYVARRLLSLSPVPQSFRDLDPTIPPDQEIAAHVDDLGDSLDVDANGQVNVATDVVYIARYLLGLAPVPASFRDADPGIPPDGEIVARIDKLR